MIVKLLRGQDKKNEPNVEKKRMKEYKMFVIANLVIYNLYTSYKYGL